MSKSKVLQRPSKSTYEAYRAKRQYRVLPIALLLALASCDGGFKTSLCDFDHNNAAYPPCPDMAAADLAPPIDATAGDLAACGAPGEPCCPNQNPPSGCCLGVMCIAGTCDPKGTCKMPCSTVGAPCCCDDGGCHCAGGLVCNGAGSACEGAPDLAQACGNNGQPCCMNFACTGNLTCCANIPDGGAGPICAMVCG